MYRGSSSGPYIGTILPTLLGFGGIHHIILSYSEQYYLIITIILEKVYRKHISSLTTDFVGVSSLQKRSSSDQAEQKLCKHTNCYWPNTATPHTSQAS